MRCALFCIPNEWMNLVSKKKMKLQREWKHKLHRKEKEWEENGVLFSVKALLLLLRTGKLISTNEDLALGTMNHFCFCFFLPFTQIWGNIQKRGHLAALVLLLNPRHDSKIVQKAKLYIATRKFLKIFKRAVINSRFWKRIGT